MDLTAMELETLHAELDRSNHKKKNHKEYPIDLGQHGQARTHATKVGDGIAQGQMRRGATTKPCGTLTSGANEMKEIRPQGIDGRSSRIRWAQAISKIPPFDAPQETIALITSASTRTTIINAPHD